MRQWQRTTALTAGEAEEAGDERWSLVENGRETVSYDVRVRWHKPVDIVRLKDQPLEELRAYTRGLARTAQRLYGPGTTLRGPAACPCCGGDAAQSDPCLTLFAVTYHRCHACGHVFLPDQPDPAVLEAQFAESADLAAVYVDQAACEQRLEQIVAPKLDWIAQAYQARHGRALASVADIGAGGGHFLALASRRGIKGTGFELSAASRAFARQAFGLDLRGDDFLAAPLPEKPFDCVAFFGLLEYAPDPRPFVRVAKQWLNPGHGLLVVEVPRYDSLATAILREFPGQVYRHMEPTSHVNCFSDASVATLLHDAGFAPVAAWYFGMDAYELLTQMALALDDGSLVARFAHAIPGLQRTLDRHGCCDDLIVAAVPRA